MDLVRRHAGGIALDRAAYQAREHLACPLTGDQFDHTEDSDLVSETLIGTPCSRTSIWTKAEVAERRQKAVLARSIKVALPWENSDDDNWSLLTRFGLYLGAALNTVVDVALHKRDRNQASEETQNPHGHLLIPTREWDAERQEFGAKTRVLDDRKTGGPFLKRIRKTWEEMVNQSLPAWAEPVCCKSHADLGDGFLPRKHLGRIATELERKGYHTRAGDYNALVDEHNALEVKVRRLRKELSTLEQSGPEATTQGLPVVAVTVTDGVPTAETLPTPLAAVAPIRSSPMTDEPTNPILIPRTLEDEFDEVLANVGHTVPPAVPVSVSSLPAVPDDLSAPHDSRESHEAIEFSQGHPTSVPDTLGQELDLLIRPRTLVDDLDEALASLTSLSSSDPPSALSR